MALTNQEKTYWANRIKKLIDKKAKDVIAESGRPAFLNDVKAECEDALLDMDGIRDYVELAYELADEREALQQRDFELKKRQEANLEEVNAIVNPIIGRDLVYKYHTDRKYVEFGCQKRGGVL